MHRMIRQTIGRSRSLWLVGLAAVVLIAAHLFPLYYLLSHKVLSASVVAGLLLVVLIKHLGMIGPVYALFRRRSQKLKK
jgi:O-antigen ligase